MIRDQRTMTDTRSKIIELLQADHAANGMVDRVVGGAKICQPRSIRDADGIEQAVPGDITYEPLIIHFKPERVA